MTIKDWRVRIEDMLEAIERIQRYTRGCDEAAFARDDRTQDAVVRNLEIIGEAAHKVPAHVTERHKEIPWTRMAEMRNILVHEYHSVDSDLILATVRNDLPDLVKPLRAVLREEVEG